MNDYIKREDIIKALGELCNTHAGQSTGLTALVYAAKTVAGIPAADVVERKKGKWIEDDDGYQICSECGAEHHWCDYRASFCEDCGADMRRKADGNSKNL